MFAEHFGLNENPFSITPDPRYLYLQGPYADALAHLRYGLTESGGFLQLTGEVGTGKTMLLRSLSDQLPEHVDVALVFNPHTGLAEFMQAICAELGVPAADGESARRLTERLNRHLLDTHARGRRTVLIIDEAQNLHPDLLEQIRMLTNLETRREKLLHIILSGQPELRDMLAAPGLRQLAQRFTGRCHLRPLTPAETRDYITHRLSVAGAGGTLFTPAAIRTIHRRTGGIPRLVNVLAERSLLGAYARGDRGVTPRVVRHAADEVFAGWRMPRARKGLRPATVLAPVVLILAVSVAFGGWQHGWFGPSAPPGSGNSDPALISVLARPAGRTDTAVALDTLMGLWGVDRPRGAPTAACETAASAGLRCLYRQTDWRALKRFNRPAVIELRDEAGWRHHVVLAGLDNRRAELVVGDTRLDVPLPALREHFNGRTLIVWRPPEGIRGVLREGMTGESVRRLRGLLARLPEYTGTDDNGTIFDTGLAETVRRFQRREGLTVDGIAGEATLLRLNTRLDRHGPRLIRPGGS